MTDKTTTSISRRRLWLMRLSAMIILPGLILGALELGLRICGYGYDTHYFRRITVKGQEFYVPNETFCYRFFPPALARPLYPVRIPAVKPAHAYRIFVFGESAANGDPDPTYGFCRYLQVLLSERYPGTEFEVECVAITAIDSNVILPIARECARHQGDLWLIYMGNNEMVGPFGAETTYGWRAPGLGMIRTILALKTTRIGQLMDALGRRLRSNAASFKEWGGMQMFAHERLGYDSPARLRAYANFKANLEDILLAAKRARVPVILSTVGVDLRDCAPFASMHNVSLDAGQTSAWSQIFEAGKAAENAGSNQVALAAYQQAAQIDPEYAELQFRMGECDLALTNDAQARSAFERARDYDALDFRADTRINAIIRDVAARHAGQEVQLVDAAKLLARQSPKGIPGFDFFYEHVHLNFAGNYLLACHYAGQIKRLLPPSITATDRGNWASAELCNRRLAVTTWDRLRVFGTILKRINVPPFTGQFNHAAALKIYDAKLQALATNLRSQTPAAAAQLYEQALALAPDDVLLHANFEQFLEARGDLTRAIIQCQCVCKLTPENPATFYYAGRLLVRTGRIAEAKEYFSQALSLRPAYAEAQKEMGEILANQQKTDLATVWFQRAIKSNPKFAEAYLNLGFLLQNRGNLAEAMAYYQMAADLEPGGVVDYFNRANIALNSYRWEEAMADWRAAVETEPEFWQAHYQLGVQFANEGQFEMAAAEFQAALRYRPDFIGARLDLGAALATQGKSSEAMAAYQTVLKLAPDNAAAKAGIAAIQSKITPSH